MMLETVMLAVAVLATDASEIAGNDAWAGRASHPAVLNPPCAVADGQTLPMAGTWEFAGIDGKISATRNELSPWAFFRQENWNSSRVTILPRPITVPGVWEAQGVGKSGMSDCWVSRDNSRMPIRHCFMGEGWYRRRMTVPAAWKGRRIWLKPGNIRGEAHIWVNDRPVALVNDYCATHKFEITDLVVPGEEAKFVFQIDNRAATSSGCTVSRHRWGGFVRAPELEATTVTFIDDAWVRGDFDKRTAEVHVTVADGRARSPSAPQGKDQEKKIGVENRCTADGSNSGLIVRATVEGETAEFPNPTIQQSNNQTTLSLPLRSFRPWSPSHPNLYTAKVELVEKVEVAGQSRERVLHTRFERFGVRKLEVVGTDFRLNGKPFFVRGFGDDTIYPIDGMTKGDRAFHRAHLSLAKEAGFNQVRLHTHCEVPEYFDVADELGILIQPELPYYCDQPTEYGPYRPREHLKELWENFRRHPSFAFYGMGNEGTHGTWMDRQLYLQVKRTDPDRLSVNQSGNYYGNSPANSDFRCAHQSWWEQWYKPDECEMDYSRPVTLHEYLNLCIKTDYRTEGDYTGAWLPPETAEKRRRFVATRELDMDWGARLQDAQIALQKIWQKDGIERARLEPRFDGYCFWTIVDVVVYNAAADSYSAQGLFDPFWRPKRGGFTAAEFAVFNSPDCVLVEAAPTNRVWTCGERVTKDVFLAHYGAEMTAGATLEWRLRRSDGSVAVSGTKSLPPQRLGPTRRIATLDFTVPGSDRALALTLELAVVTGDGRRVSNEWDYYAFPPGKLADVLAYAEKKGVVLIRGGSRGAVSEAFDAGRPAIAIGAAPGVPNVKLGWWWMGKEVGTAVKNDDPALAGLPIGRSLSPAFFRIFGEGRALPFCEGLLDKYLIVSEGGAGCFANLAVRPLPHGGRIFRTWGLDLLSDKPEANALLKSLIDAAAK